MLFDTHAHLDDSRFDEDRDELIKSLNDKNVSTVLTVGCDTESSKEAIKLSDKYDFIYAAVGIHPHECENISEEEIEEIAGLCKNPKVKAIGEIGLDYYYDNAFRDVQIKWFERQMQLASDLKLPFIIHNREAHEDTMKVLRKFCPSEMTGVIHCFSGSVEMSREIFKMGLFISVGGTLTFKNSVKVKEVLKSAPIERVLIETDCPYLTPEPHRGERNDPSYTVYVSEKIAELKNMSTEEVIKITSDNGKKLFGII